MITRNEFIENFVTNLEKERAELSLSQTEMAQALDMSLSSYKRIVHGESSKIDIYTVYRLQKLTDKLCDEVCGISSPLIESYNLMRQLSDSQLRFITDLIRFEVEFAKDLKASASTEEEFVTLIVPNGNMQDGMIYDSFSLEKINIAPYRKRYSTEIDYALKVTSSHMQPVYHKNDVLLIHRGPLRDGDTGLFVNRLTGLVYIRRFIQANPSRIEPLNNYGETFFIDNSDPAETERWIKLGYVVTKMRT